jgi:drug/metabolite transporter (DMT)-like permease
MDLLELLEITRFLLVGIGFAGLAFVVWQYRRRPRSRQPTVAAGLILLGGMAASLSDLVAPENLILHSSGLFAAALLVIVGVLVLLRHRLRHPMPHWQ